MIADERGTGPQRRRFANVARDEVLVGISRIFGEISAAGNEVFVGKGIAAGNGPGKVHREMRRGNLKLRASGEEGRLGLGVKRGKKKTG